MHTEDREAIEEVAGIRIAGVGDVGGGDDSQAFAVTTSDGDVVFVKVSFHDEAADKFDAEIQGLQSMRETETVRIPRPIAVTSLPRCGGAALIMEHIAFKRANTTTQKQFGEQLANMHSTPAGDRFGYIRDNWCGATPQVNEWCDDWVDFFADHRLRKQASMIEDKYEDKDLATHVDALCGIMREKFFQGLQVRPSLLHGDLWSGNWSADEKGFPVLYDPACYYGHSEAELSILTMFGSPSKAFFEAYHKIIPKHEEKFEERQHLYQLYHYMNHYNLFGKGYRGSCMSILGDLLK